MQKVHNIHNGCESNLYDSEKSRIELLQKGYIRADTKEDADVILFHSCTFSQEKEDESTRIIKDLIANGKKVVVSGCFLSENIKAENLEYIKHENLANSLPILSVDPYLLDQHNERNSTDLNYPFVQISKGCYGSCTFCSIKQVKGIHKSRSIDDILQDIEVRKEFSGIKLVGEEVAGYGRDIGMTLQDLILVIVDHFPHLKIKMGSLNAKMLKVFSDEELEIFVHPNISGNVHIPIQSASTSVLTNMKRGYSIEEYVTIYNTLKSIGVKNISGDIIIGFPNETKADHQLNLSMMDNYDFSFMEVFIYQERPGTKAATMKQIDYPIRKKRATEVLVNYLNRHSHTNNIPLHKLIQGQPIFNTNFNFT